MLSVVIAVPSPRAVNTGFYLLSNSAQVPNALPRLALQSPRPKGAGSNAEGFGLLVSHTTRSVPLNPVRLLKGVLDRAIWLADKFNLAGRIHRRDAEFAEVLVHWELP